MLRRQPYAIDQREQYRRFPSCESGSIATAFRPPNAISIWQSRWLDAEDPPHQAPALHSGYRMQRVSE